jgi:hypothetical protein
MKMVLFGTLSKKISEHTILPDTKKSAADLVFAPTLALTGIFPRTYI